MALDEEGRASKATAKRIGRLERELARKEKALAEAAALLVLKKGRAPLGGRGRRHGRRERQMILESLGEAVASGARLASACALVGISARTVQRWRARPEGEDRRCGPRRQPSNALTWSEQAKVVEVMTSPQYAGMSPKQIVPDLADRGQYLASESTMYRLRRRFRMCVSRRSVARTCVTRAKTAHQAVRPNQVWSWDITWLPTTIRGQHLFLCLVMDIWSRRIVGWQVRERESADEAAALIHRACDENVVNPQGLVLHSDNGTQMRGSTMVKGAPGHETDIGRVGLPQIIADWGTGGRSRVRESTRRTRIRLPAPPPQKTPQVR